MEDDIIEAPSNKKPDWSNFNLTEVYQQTSTQDEKTPAE